MSLLTAVPHSGAQAYSRRGIRAAASVIVCAALAWSWFLPGLRGWFGPGAGAACLPAGLAAALLLCVWTAGGPLAKAGLWLALAASGNAAALQLLDAGTRVHYQHLLPWSVLTGRNHIAALCLLLVQAAAVVWGTGRRVAAFAQWLRRLKPWRLALAAVLCAACSATVSRDPRFFVQELAFATLLQLVNAANIILAVSSLPAWFLSRFEHRFQRWFPLDAPATPGRPDRFDLFAAVWVTVFAALLCLFSYERHPHLSDEVSYLLQSRYFAQGMLAMPLREPAGAFELDLMTYDSGRWYSPFPPGWPAMLSVGVLLGAPWLVNPVLAGVNLLLASAFLRHLYSPGLVRLAVLLLAVSPWFLFLGASFMAHMFSLACALAAFWGVATARRSGRALWAFLAGLAVGAEMLIRPLDGLIVAGVAFLLAIGLGGLRFPVRQLAALAVGAALIGGLALPYNQALTGDPTRSPVMAYFDKYYGKHSNDYGFGPERGVGWPLDPYPGHTPWEALINADLNLSAIHFELFGWGTGSLIFVALFLISGTLQRRDAWMILICAAVFVAYSGYWFSGGPDFAARYWFLMIVPLVVLASRGIESLAGRIRAAGLSAAYPIAAVSALIPLAMVNFLPWRAVDKYHNYLQMRPDIAKLAARHDFRGGLVLIRGHRFPDYASAAVFNALEPSAEQPLYVWDKDAATRQRTLEAFPNRPVWIVEGPSLTGAGFRVVAGPLRRTPSGAAQTRTTPHDPVVAGSAPFLRRSP